MLYTISYSQPHRHFLSISITLNQVKQNQLKFQLPSWRPGRYELGNFAKNIRDFKVVDEENNILEFEKTSKDCWLIPETENKTLTVSYLYYANEVNAGSCYVDNHLFYVNPIQCCMYIVGQENNSLQLHLKYPKHYTISLPERLKTNENYEFNTFDQLVETPFVASEDLNKISYSIDGYASVFNIWFQGVKEIPKEQILKDFKAFTKLQLDYFGSLPVDEYDFIFIITPFKSYHGVEHTASTIITLGPDIDLFKPEMYREFLHISSHELYHTWNIKALRPAEMKPYNLAGENYSKLGFWYEGLTTLMGDLLLWESGVFSDEGWNTCLNKYLKVHYFNHGHKHLSVADSSFDTWLDGYQIGIPNRKVSIYQDGALCMLMIHAAILEYSNGKKSMHTVMKDLYSNSDVLLNGFSESFLLNTLVKEGGEKVKNIINNYIYGTEDYTLGILEACDYFGWTFILDENDDLFSGILGIQIQKHTEGLKVIKSINGGLADINGIAVGDIITKIDGKNAHSEQKSSNSPIQLEFKTKFKTERSLIKYDQDDSSKGYQVYKIDCKLQ